MATLREATLRLDQLVLDPNNYRFQSSDDFIRVKPERFAEPTVQSRAELRLRDESLRELKSSINANGFIPVERLVVRPLTDDKYLVLEGNRRLAALRWIAQDHAAGAEVNPDVISGMDTLPVVIVEDEVDDGALYTALMGVRHVSGIKEWKGFERAQLVVQLIDQHGLDAGDVASRLGMSRVEVNRRYRSMKALEQMAESEDYGEYARPALYPIFHEALSLPVLRNWLKWSDEANRFEESSMLDSFYALISPKAPEREDEDEAPPKLARYSDVRMLRDILPDDTATRILLDPERDLAEAVAVVKKTEVSRSWRGQIARTIETLGTIGLDQVTGLNQEDIEQLNDLMQAAKNVIDSHAKLSE